MTLIPFEVKLARFRAVDRFPSGRVNREYDKRRKKSGDEKRRRKRRNLKARLYARRKKRELRDETRYVLAIARRVLAEQV